MNDLRKLGALPGTTRPLYSSGRDGEPWREAPFEGLDDSYSTNRIALLLPKRQLWLEPVEPAGNAYPPRALRKHPTASPLLPLTIVSAWNPAGAPTTFEHNMEFHDTLLQYAKRHKWTAIPAVTVAANGSWFEASVALQGVSARFAHEIARHFRQHAVIRISADGWEPLAAYAHHLSDLRRVSWKVLPRKEQLCPVRQVMAQPSLCTAHGGPWTSGSIGAFAAWMQHRHVGLRLLGCSPCKDGTDPIFMSNGNALVRRETAIALREYYVGSRHGSYAVGGYTREVAAISTTTNDSNTSTTNTDTTGE